MESLEEGKFLKKRLLDSVNNLIKYAIIRGLTKVSVEVNKYPISVIKYVETHLSRIQGFDNCNRIYTDGRIKYLNIKW